MLLQEITGIEDPYVAFGVVAACIFAIFWVLDVWGIVNLAALFGISSGGGDGGSDFGDGGGDGGE